MSIFQAMVIMISFATLVVAVLALAFNFSNQKK
ncbi:putative holin-like toxin [Cytobacillus gottheilii]|nr:putative holin-like toxin [Cytobacillus gottheilii]